MPEDALFPILLIVAIAVLGSFALGTTWNVRKGNQVMKWIRDGLPLIGERSTYRWLGSSVVELKIAKAKSPFRNSETLVVFEPRDILLFWGWARWRGRRDMLIFRAQLESAPGYEIEVFDPNAWTTHNTERDVAKKNWTKLDLAPHPALRAYYSSKADTSQISRIVNLANQLDGKLIRLSIHRDLPNLEIHWLLPDLKTARANQVFGQVKQIASTLTRE
jgi:hypothetical protein